MSVIKPKYAASAALAITLNSLGAGAARESTAVDNSSSLYADALVRVTVQPGAGTPANYFSAIVYAYGSEDGTLIQDNATGTDAALTMRTPTNLRQIGSVSAPLASTAFVSAPMSVAAVFGGILPRKWGIVVENTTGIALNSSGNSASFTGVNLEAV